MKGARRGKKKLRLSSKERRRRNMNQRIKSPTISEGSRTFQGFMGKGQKTHGERRVRHL